MDGWLGKFSLMPRGFKDADTLVAEIKMTRTDHKGAFLIVEGADDVRFWSAMRHEKCELVDGEGKKNVVNAVRLLNEENIRGVLGIVDDDYDQLLGLSLESKNLVATDAHDLECLLCRSSALCKVLAEFGEPRKIQRLTKEKGSDIRDCLLARAIVFGRLRLVAEYFRLDINFGVVRIQRFVDEKTWKVDCRALIRELAQTQQNSTLDEDSLKRHLAKLPEFDPWRIVRGHDVIMILRIGLKNVLGTIKNSVGDEQIARVLRAGMSMEELKETKLWADIRVWETQNAPHRVIAA